MRKTPTGQPSTAETCSRNSPRVPAAALILEYRALAKLKSTYTDKLPRADQSHTGACTPVYHQAVAATGRLSSRIRTCRTSRSARRRAGASARPSSRRPGHVLLAADYSQIELRIMAHLSGDDGLLSAFAERPDIHQATAAEVFGVGARAGHRGPAPRAKAINFGLIYGMSAFGLARQLGIERGAAQDTSTCTSSAIRA